MLHCCTVMTLCCPRLQAYISKPLELGELRLGTVFREVRTA